MSIQTARWAGFCWQLTQVLHKEGFKRRGEPTLPGYLLPLFTAVVWTYGTYVAVHTVRGCTYGTWLYMQQSYIKG